jgi:RNA recognition motif-containing protein
MDVFVASLPFKLKEPELRALFEPYGDVGGIKLIKDEKGLNKGFGFVTMPDAAQANAAIKALNGKEISGRAIVVSRSQQTHASKNKRSYTSEGATAAKRAPKSSYADFKRGGKPAFGKKTYGAENADKPASAERGEFEKVDGAARKGFKKYGSAKEGFKKSATGKPEGEKRSPWGPKPAGFKKTTGGKGGFKGAGKGKGGFKKRAAPGGAPKSGGRKRRGA